MNKLKHLIFLLFFIFSCSNEEINNVHLDGWTKLFSITKENILTVVGQSDFDNLRDYLKYDISVYTITYFTTIKAKNSPLGVAFPDSNTGMPILNFNHGTTSLHSDAPTEDLLHIVFQMQPCSIYVIPDYLGLVSEISFTHIID